MYEENQKVCLFLQRSEVTSQVATVFEKVEREKMKWIQFHS